MRTALLLILAACGSAPGDLVIQRVEPDHGPLAGGTRIVVHGDRFADGDAGPTRVLVGGRQAELASAIDDETLEFILPPGDRPGSAELLVFNRNGVAVSTTAFHYAALPTITSVMPAEVLYSQPARLTVTGSGFLDDAAGTPVLLVDGVPAQDIAVVSDTELTFTPPVGRPLDRPRIELANARGLATKPRAFRYRPSLRGGLLLFTLSTPTFALFFDPVDRTLLPIPRVGPFEVLSTVVVDEDGEYWGNDRSGRGLGRLDLATQRLGQTIQIGFRPPAATRIDGMQYGIDRWTSRFIRWNLDGAYAVIGEDALPCCGSYGIASDGTTTWFTHRTGADKFIRTIDLATGELGAPVKLLAGPNFHVEELRYFEGKLYATSRDATLVTIDPVTGVVAVVASSLRATAMEVFR